MSSHSRKTITYIVVWALMLLGFWLLLSGYVKPLLLSFGFVSMLSVVFLVQRMDSFDELKVQLPMSIPFIRYAGWLAGQVVLSSVTVSKLVWGKNKKLSPLIVKLPVSDPSVKNHVLYANSITLTPGTLSIDIDAEHVTVHALEAQSVESLRAGEMARKVSTVS